MCGRFTVRQPGDLVERFEAVLHIEEGLAPRFNVAPTQSLPIVTAGPAGRQIELARWGLVPGWAKDPSIGNRLINARAETLAEKPAFRTVLQRQRCLVPADGFFEWTAAASGGAGKTPCFVHRRDDALFAFAGLFDRWRDASGRWLTSFTIITTAPNALMRRLHDRMPAMLVPEYEHDWLDPDLTTRAGWSVLLQPYPAELLEVYPVSTLVNNPRHDTPAVVTPAA